MSKKIYTSKSEISIKVLLDNGKTVRVAFTPRTMGSSVFMTDDEELQKAIEGHKEYGKLFVCKNAGPVNTATASQPTKEHPSAGAQDQDVAPQPEEPLVDAGASTDSTKQVHVGSLQEAKDYLAEKFDISRTSLRNRDAVLSSGMSHGVVFVLPEKK